MAGRKAVPVDVLVDQGKSHLTKEQIEARREREAALQFGTDKIDRPKWLTGADATKAWEVLSAELLEKNLMTNVDVFSLAMACDAYAQYVKATRMVRSKGQTMAHTNKSGATNLVENPAVRIAHKYFQMFKSMCSEFGLSPAARARLALPTAEKPKDPFAEDFEEDDDD